jgi:virginiamycin A acetyltransferase
MVEDTAAAPSVAVVPTTPSQGLQECCVAKVLVRCYRVRFLRRLCVRVALLLEGGYFFSATLREILKTYHGVEVGAYSYGPCLDPGGFPAGTKVGRYVSIAADVHVFARNHPMDRISTHPFFFNAALGLVPDNITGTSLTIEHDAWIGYGAVITPGCKRIGIGAVIGAASVVTKDVPDFAVVAGNPAKQLRFRFDELTRSRIQSSRWWELNLDALRPHQDDFTQPPGSTTRDHADLLRISDAASNPAARSAV